MYIYIHVYVHTRTHTHAHTHTTGATIVRCPTGESEGGRQMLLVDSPKVRCICIYVYTICRVYKYMYVCIYTCKYLEGGRCCWSNPERYDNTIHVCVYVCVCVCVVCVCVFVCVCAKCKAGFSSGQCMPDVLYVYTSHMYVHIQYITARQMWCTSCVCVRVCVCVCV